MAAMNAMVDQMRQVTEDLVDTYCTRIATVSELITEAYEIMAEHRNVQERLKVELKEMLAVKNSLRRKDFDLLINNALEPQYAKEQEVKVRLHKFLSSQRKVATELKVALHGGNLDEVRRLKQEIETEIREIKDLVKVFHYMETSVIERFNALLKKGPQITIGEFKEAMNGIRENFRREVLTNGIC